MGDFFETFGDDAKEASKILNITLTKRDKKGEIPLAGFPHKALDQYLLKFIENGRCVVVVDQLEDPKQAKGIVKRGVVRIVTPGTLNGDEASTVKDSYLASFYTNGKKIFVSLCDISTGKFFLIVENDIESNMNTIPEYVLIFSEELISLISNDNSNLSDLLKNSLASIVCA